MGRNTKTQYPRTGILKVRASQEHLALLGAIQKAMNGLEASEADIVSWALEDFAQKHCRGKVKPFPGTMPKHKAAGQRGKTIIIGKVI